MDKADIVTSIIATLALIVSCVSIYLSYFRRTASLIGRLASISGPDQAPEVLDDCSIEFALSNTGTLEILVREVFLEVKGRNSFVPIVTSVRPTVIKPGEVKLLSIEIPNLFFRNVANAQDTLIVGFHVFSSRGTSYSPKAAIPLNPELIGLPEDVWKPFPIGEKD